VAENGKGVPTIVWVLLALVVAWFIYQQTKKAAAKATGKLGEGIGKGATETLLTQGGSALGSFLGGLFGSKKPGSSAHDSDDEEDDEGGYDTSSFRVYDDEEA